MKIESDKDGLLVSKCANCIFAKFKQDKPWHKTQIGCEFGRIEKFEKRGTHTEWVEKDDVSAHEIHVFCNFMRPEAWKDEQKEQDTEFLINKVKSDNELRYGVVIWSSTPELEEVKATINSVLRQKTKPQKIVISVESADFSKLITEIKGFWGELNNDIPIFFNRLLQNDYERSIIDGGLGKINSPYYLSVKSGHVLRDDLLEDLDDRINNNCEMLAIAKEENVMFVSLILHDALGGNQEIEYEEQKLSKLEDKLVVLNEHYKKAIIEL